MKNSFLLLPVAVVIFADPLQAASLVIDSFTLGDHFLSLAGDSGNAVATEGPLGATRVSKISNRLAAPGSILSSTLSTTDGTLRFNVDGSSVFNGPLNLSLNYGQGTSFILPRIKISEKERWFFSCIFFYHGRSK